MITACERYRILYCRAFGRTEWELFGIERPSILSDDDGEGAEMAYVRTSLRSEKRELREQMRAAGLDYRQIATEFSRVYKLRPRAAWREAHGWSLQEAADNINTYRGDTGLDPGGISGMTSAHLCEYEKWPGYGETPTGRRPTPYLLAVLASIYDCQVNDLIDLADRQHLPKADLLILDTYTRPQTAAAPVQQLRPTLLRSLVAQRHWMKFETFNAQFTRSARELAEREQEPALAKVTMSERTLERWYSGDAKSMPRPDASRVLEHMFGFPVHQLLRPADDKPAGETSEYNPAFPDGNRYVVLALPRGSQRIVIDVTDTETEEPGTAAQPVHRLTLVGTAGSRSPAQRATPARNRGPGGG